MKFFIVLFLASAVATVYSLPGWASNQPHRIDPKTGQFFTSDTTLWNKIKNCFATSASPVANALTTNGFNISAFFNQPPSVSDKIVKILANCNILINSNSASKFPEIFKNIRITVIALEIPECKSQNTTTSATTTTTTKTTSATTVATPQLNLVPGK